METRLVVALSLIGVFLVLLAWALIKYTRKRRQFAVRQAGRGKNNTTVPPQ